MIYPCICSAGHLTSPTLAKDCGWACPPAQVRQTQFYWVCASWLLPFVARQFSPPSIQHLFSSESASEYRSDLFLSAPPSLAVEGLSSPKPQLNKKRQTNLNLVLSLNDESRTNNKFSFFQTFVPACVIPRSSKHVHNAGASTLLAELHLQYSIVYRLSRYLPSKCIQFAVRDLEVGCRIFMLGMGSRVIFDN